MLQLLEEHTSPDFSPDPCVGPGVAEGLRVGMGEGFRVGVGVALLVGVGVVILRIGVGVGSSVCHACDRKSRPPANAA